LEIAELIRLGKLPSLEKLKEENQQQQLEVQYRQQQRQQNYEKITAAEEDDNDNDGDGNDIIDDLMRRSIKKHKGDSSSAVALIDKFAKKNNIPIDDITKE